MPPVNLGIGPPAWCYAALGLERGADPVEARQAYLQRVRETHPDKGGSAEEFQRVVSALEAFAGVGEATPELDETPESTTSKRSSKFTLEEVTQLAKQVKQLHSERVHTKRRELAARSSADERRRHLAQVKAAEVREQEEAARLDRALRLQRRGALPVGVELCWSCRASAGVGRCVGLLMQQRRICTGWRVLRSRVAKPECSELRGSCNGKPIRCGSDGGHS
mmetsp:Transcript_65909/g.153145  ORF Transcript_65909/g.153145 Transcript_65909/m.153145 type:complete len:222 (-) Transcript_65909:88-753(-)